MTEKTILKVVGDQMMHCGGCESTITFALSNLSGVEAVRADHKTQLIELMISDEGADLEKVQSELDWIGYKTAVVEE